jgi:hypothetical protein
MAERNLLYLIIGVLTVVVVMLAYQHHRDQQRGLEIHIGPGGASVEGQ